ncbi:hypothetical protein [Cupriavidus pauculus]|uniref:hypothetical protein n=1 Tax=Cupriavidus pauculus TaxID=82633 RepID=UPI0012FE3754|nr:hypothetical protein [Cupriavidus pauculus]MBY4734151.1 hypothetical protein [Cupriavidus pauculus]
MSALFLHHCRPPVCTMAQQAMRHGGEKHRAASDFWRPGRLARNLRYRYPKSRSVQPPFPFPKEGGRKLLLMSVPAPELESLKRQAFPVGRTCSPS